MVTVADKIVGNNVKITRNLEETAVSSFGVFEVGKNSTKTMNIILQVNDKNKSVDASLEMTLNLNDSTTAQAEDIEYTIVNGKAEISAYTGTLDTFVIPETINGYPTTLKVGTTTAAGVTLPSTVKSVVIPKTMETIPQMAFCKCTNLKNVVIQEGVKKIDYAAFAVASINQKSLNVLNKVKDYIGKKSSYTITLDSANTAYALTDGKITAK